MGKLPGVTRSVAQRIKILEAPRVYLIDTPGLLVPNIRMPSTGMKLALTGAVKDSQVGEERLVDFLLFTLNTRAVALSPRGTLILVLQMTCSPECAHKLRRRHI